MASTEPQKLLFRGVPGGAPWRSLVRICNYYQLACRREKKFIRYPTNFFYRDILSFLISDKINTSAVSLVSPDIHDSQDSQDSRDSQKIRLSQVLGQLDIVSLVSQQL